jgi:hypothetical protein
MRDDREIADMGQVGHAPRYVGVCGLWQWGMVRGGGPSRAIAGPRGGDPTVDRRALSLPNPQERGPAHPAPKSPVRRASHPGRMFLA